MLMPKRVKRRKQFRGSMAGKATKGTAITYGDFGLVACDPCWIKSNQIEAARVAMTRYMKRGLRFSQINRLQQNLQKLVWVLVKVHWNIG